MANGSTTKVIPIVLGIVGAMVTAVSLTYGITQGRASEKMETIKTEFETFKGDYEAFRRTDAELKGMIIERLDTTVSLLKSHMGGPQ
jgi:hypothetical protein